MATTMLDAPPIRPSSLRMSYDEYINWVEDGTHAEWVNGEVIVFMPAKRTHQNIVEFLLRLIGLFNDLFDLGEVKVAPFEMKLVHSSREPDLLFVTQENLEQLTNDRLYGGADLAIEVISRGSVRRDRDDKWREYRDAGICEYWIIDSRPHKEWASFYRLDDAGDYVLFATEEDERVESQVLPDFWLDPNWLWEAESRDPLLTLCEMRGLSAEQTQAFHQLLINPDQPQAFTKVE